MHFGDLFPTSCSRLRRLARRRGSPRRPREVSSASQHRPRLVILHKKMCFVDLFLKFCFYILVGGFALHSSTSSRYHFPMLLKSRIVSLMRDDSCPVHRYFIARHFLEGHLKIKTVWLYCCILFGASGQYLFHQSSIELPPGLRLRGFASSRRDLTGDFGPGLRRFRAMVVFHSQLCVLADLGICLVCSDFVSLPADLARDWDLPAHFLRMCIFRAFYLLHIWFAVVTSGWSSAGCLCSPSSCSLAWFLVCSIWGNSVCRTSRVLADGDTERERCAGQPRARVRRGGKKPLEAMASSMSLLRRLAPSLYGRIGQSHHHHGKLLCSAALKEPLPSPSPSPSPAAQDEGVHMTENCIRRLKELQANQESDKAKMLRLSVETGGCSGFQYVFGLEDKRNADDRVFEKEGVKLVVDNISYDFVKGATVDYIEEF